MFCHVLQPQSHQSCPSHCSVPAVQELAAQAEIASVPLLQYTQAWSTIASGYNGLYQKARDFVKKTYTAIENFGKTVVSACKKAWDWIKGFF